MKVIAKNSKVRSTLHGVFIAHAGVDIIFSYVFSYGGICFHDEMTFQGISDLIVYLMKDCGYDSLTFKNI